MDNICLSMIIYPGIRIYLPYMCRYYDTPRNEYKHYWFKEFSTAECLEILRKLSLVYYTIETIVF